MYVWVYKQMCAVVYGEDMRLYEFAEKLKEKKSKMTKDYDWISFNGTVIFVAYFILHPSL